MKIFKVSNNQNTLLALAISDLLQNNKSGIEPSKEHSNNAKYSICRLVSHKKVFECNIIEMMTGWSSTNLFIFVWIGNPKWPSPGDLFYHWTLWEFQ
jgi:ABC-type phosphate transport system substrate-binding protein